MAKKTVRVSYTIETLSGRVLFGVHSSTMKNVLRGLRERVFAVERDGTLQRPPQPVPGSFQRLHGFRNKIVRGVNAFPIEARAFAELYTGRRRAIYMKAVESLEVASVTRDDASLKTFVKCEKINFSSKPDPAPRVIQPRSPRYNVELGRYLKPLECRLLKRIGKVIQKDGKGVGPAVAKGVDAVQLGGIIAAKWASFDDPVAVGCDASRFDQHVSVEALEWEHGVYSRCFKQPGELQKLLSWQLHNKGRAFADDGVVKYEVEGCRMSGDMNTGLGNCLIMCGLVHTFMQESRIQRYDLINNGDDCVIFVERKDLCSVLEFGVWCRDFGFTMVMENPVDVLEQVEFCQMKPVLTSRGYCMVRNHGTVFSKDSTTTHDMSDPKVFSAYCGAIGDCGMALAFDVPVQSAFYSAFCRAGRPSNMTVTGGMGWWRGALSKRSRVAPTDETRYSYWLAFGVTPEEQIIMESQLDAISIMWGAPHDTDLCRGSIDSRRLL